MANLPALAHQVGSGAIASAQTPTPQRVIQGHHPAKYPDQIYGMILPQSGFPYSGGVAGRHRRGHIAGKSRADAVRIGRVLASVCPSGTVPCTTAGGTLCCNEAAGGCSDPLCGIDSLSAKGGRVPSRAPGRHRRAVAGATMADAIRLASGGGKSVAGSNVPPSYPNYPGNAQRHAAISRRGVAGSQYPPSYPDYPGNAQRRDETRARAARGGMAGYAGHGHHHDHHDHHGHGDACCDSCAHGGPCEGCDGKGGCGKPNCGCNV